MHFIEIVNNCTKIDVLSKQRKIKNMVPNDVSDCLGIMFTTIFLFLFRCATYDELLREAEKQFAMNRLSTMKPHHQFLVQHVPDQWGSKKPINKETVTRAMAGNYPQPRRSERDRALMRAFLNNVPDQMLYLPDVAPVEYMLPTRVPILDLTRNIMSKRSTWKYPSAETWTGWSENRAVDWRTADRCEVKEIYIGSTPPDKVMEFATWVDENAAVNQDQHMTQVISLDVEEIQITRWDYLRLTSEQYAGKTIKLSRNLNVCTPDETEFFRNKPDKWRNLPTKIMLGDGIKWMGIVAFDIDYQNGYKYVKVEKVQKYLTKFISVIPIVTGVGIKGDVMMIEELFTDLNNGKRIRMKGYVDIAALAVLAGWRLEATNMTALAMIGMGSVMNKISSCADWLWGKRFDLLPKELKVYAIADVKVGHILYSTLIAALQLEIFPDPDIMCYLTSTSQEVFTLYFATWIRDALDTAVVYTNAVSAATSRAELVKTIRLQTAAGKISIDTPELVTAFADGLLVGSPTVTYGGPRFLHTARDQAIRQYRVLQQNKVKFHVDPFTKEISALDKLYARFGHLDLDALNIKRPVVINELDLTLSVHPALQSKMFRINWETTTIQDLLNQAMWTERPQREAVFELIRMNTDKVDKFMALYSDHRFADTYRKYYEKIRMIAMRTDRYMAAEVPACEEAIKSVQLTALERQARLVEARKSEIDEVKKELERLNKDLKYNRDILDKMKAEVELDKQVDRSETRLEMLRKRAMESRREATLNSVPCPKRPRSRSRSKTKSPARADKRPRRGLSPLTKMRDHESDNEPEGQNPQDGEDPTEDWEETPSPRRSRGSTIVLSDPSDEEVADEPTTRVVRFKDQHINIK